MELFIKESGDEMGGLRECLEDIQKKFYIL
jgi:hypothetical protein